MQKGVQKRCCTAPPQGCNVAILVSVSLYGIPYQRFVAGVGLRQVVATMAAEQ